MEPGPLSFLDTRGSLTLPRHTTTPSGARRCLLWPPSAVPAYITGGASLDPLLDGARSLPWMPGSP